MSTRWIVVLTVVVTACSGGGDSTSPVAPPPPPAPVVAVVQVTPAAVTIAPAGSVVLVAQPVTASGSPVTATVAWRSSAPSIATVDGIGLVTGVTPGQATITATAGAVSGISLVTVLAPVVSVTLVGDTTALLPGATRQLVATPRDAAGAPLTDRSVTWSTSAPSVVTVTSAGLVIAVAPGQATITASAGAVTATRLVTVIAPVASVTLVGDTAALLPGATRQFAATPRDAAGAPLTGRSVIWATSAPSVVTVTSAGLVIAVAPGQATITASAGAVTATRLVTVLAPVASLTISPDSLLIIPDEARSFTVTLRDAGGGLLSGRPISWSSGASAIATVSATGTVTGVAAGRALVIARSEGRVDTAAVRVVIPESRLVFDRIPSQVRPGLGLGLVVRATRTGGDTLRSFSGPVTIQDESGANILLGTATAVAQNGIAVFDDLAISSVGSYRLRASASPLSPVSSGSILVTASSTLPTITVGQVQRSVLTVGVLGSSRYRIPVTLRDSAGVSVGPTPVVVAIARGSSVILSGSTTATTANGTATFDIVMQGTGTLDLSFSAPGFQTRVQGVQSPTDYWSTYVGLDRAVADSVVGVGRLVPLSVTVVNSSLSAAAVHAVTYEVSWNPAQLSLSSDSTTTGASYTINRAQIGEGVLRVTIASTAAITAVGRSTLVQRLVFSVRAGASGTQTVRVTAVDLLGPSGESLAPRRSFDVSFRVP